LVIETGAFTVEAVNGTALIIVYFSILRMSDSLMAGRPTFGSRGKSC
jgi:hypothetical protein